MITTLDLKTKEYTNTLLKSIATDLSPKVNSEEVKLDIWGTIVYISRKHVVTSEKILSANPDWHVTNLEVGESQNDPQILVADEMSQHLWNIYWNWKQWHRGLDTYETDIIDNVLHLLNEQVKNVAANKNISASLLDDLQ